MIFKIKQPCSTEYVDNFPFDTTTVATGGKKCTDAAVLHRGAHGEGGGPGPPLVTLKALADQRISG
jgi:hypothetical protein